MKIITSRENPLFKDLRNLAQDARRQRREGRTFLDGPHLLFAALDQGICPDTLIVTEAARADPEITGLLSKMPETPVLCLSAALFGQISELATPVGLMGRIDIPETPVFVPTEDCVLLDAVQDAGNVGTLLRTAAAAGVRQVLLGTGCAGAWTPRVLRAAQGAHFALHIAEHVDLPALLEGYAGQSIATVAQAGTTVYGLDLKRPTAWLFGNEGAGLSPGLKAKADVFATIPLAPGCESINVAAAAAVCLFEMRRQRTIAGAVSQGRCT